MLEQINQSGEREPLAFFSAKLDSTQRDWATYDRELYAIYRAAEHFEYLLQGCEVTVITDHKPLLSIIVLKNRIKIERRLRQVEYISQFTNNIEHISGLSNIIADTLSRPEVASIKVTVTPEMIVDVKFKSNNNLDHKIRDVFLNNNKTILCSISHNIN